MLPWMDLLGWHKDEPKGKRKKSNTRKNSRNGWSRNNKRNENDADHNLAL